MKALKLKAYALGKKAFHDGKKRVPAWDSRLMVLLKGKKVGEGTPIMESWAKGWDTENLKGD